MVEVVRYSAGLASEWNDFVKKSKNGTFLFNRGYMDYHADRFRDCSLMIYRKGRLSAVLPANVVGDILYSHQGLTYGGFILNDKVTVADMLEIFEEVNSFLKKNGVAKVVYKAIPYIYADIPAQEDLYALFRQNARLIAGNISSTIYQNNKLKFSESRQSGVRKAKRQGLIVTESDDMAAFWEILSANLNFKYGVMPVHSLAEIYLLKSRFPENIRLFLCLEGQMPLGGTVVFETGRVLHVQYISANEDGKAKGALDILFDFLINERYAEIPVFDFGQSTEKMGTILNEKLIFQKEGFGGRGVMYNTYEYLI